MFRILRRLYVSDLKRPLQLIAFFALIANLMILILDEPNAHLDTSGTTALSKAIIAEKISADPP